MQGARFDPKPSEVGEKDKKKKKKKSEKKKCVRMPDLNPRGVRVDVNEELKLL